MDSSSSESNTYPEVRPLLPVTQPPDHLTARERLSHIRLSPTQLCPLSKAVVLILLWTLAIGVVFVTTKGGMSFAADTLAKEHPKLYHSYNLVFTHILYMLVFILLPVIGFMADIYCGRHRIVFLSLCLLSCGTALLSIASVQFFSHSAMTPFSNIQQNDVQFYAVSIAGFLFIIIGAYGYKATMIQFGLDQLLEAPSDHLGLFVHWIEYFTVLGMAIGQAIISVLYNCKKNTIIFIMFSLPLFFTCTLLVMLTFTCWKRHWFYTEPVPNNPYKIVVKVLNFARKHKFPLQRSAFTYTDDEEPTRIDFGKERYGGPYKTEQVEDVKVFLRILLVLLALGPVFAMEVPTTTVLPIFINHVVEESNYSSCDWKRVIIDAYFLRFLMIVVSFPLYIWIIYSVLRQCIPKLFFRLCVGILTLLAGLLFVYLVEILGHYFYYKDHGHGVLCMFREMKHKHYDYHIGLPWAVTLMPTFLMELGLTVVIVTVNEFISAQSPQTMKGLLIGVTFAIRGIFEVIVTVAILPFSVNEIWESRQMIDNPPPIFSCGFGYLSLICTVGLIGFILFLVVVRRYKYRKRDDPPFNQAIVERVWANT